MCRMHSGGFELYVAPLRGFRCACIAAERARTRSGSELVAAHGERVERGDARGALQTCCSPSRPLWRLQRACFDAESLSACNEQYVEYLLQRRGCVLDWLGVQDVMRMLCAVDHALRGLPWCLPWCRVISVLETSKKLSSVQLTRRGF